MPDTCRFRATTPAIAAGLANRFAASSLICVYDYDFCGSRFANEFTFGVSVSFVPTAPELAAN
jgi:hypothetical protein